MAYLKQLKCPSCGATLELSNPQDIMVECPYCHQKVINEYSTSCNRNRTESRVKISSMTDHDKVSLFVQALIDNEMVPENIFDKIVISGIENYYIPIYFYDGTFRLPWNARDYHFVEKQRINYQGKLETYSEEVPDYINGETIGEFHVSCIPPSIVVKFDLPINALYIDPEYSIPFSHFDKANDKSEIVIITDNISEVWQIEGKGEANLQASSQANSEAPGKIISCSCLCELKDSYIVYVPLQIINYLYSNCNYSCIILDERLLNITYPESEQIKTLKDERDKLEQLNKDSDEGFGCVMMLVVYLVLWFIVGFIRGTIFGCERAEEGLTVWIALIITILIKIGDRKEKKQKEQEKAINEQKIIDISEALLNHRKLKKEKGEKFLRGF